MRSRTSAPSASSLLLRYLDSSALVKLVVPESESDRLLAHLATGGEAVSSILSVVEVSRAVARAGVGAEAAPRVEAVLEAVDLRRIDTEIITAAAGLEPAEIRTLDAVHLATALELAAEIDELVAYDRRLLHAAERHGLATASP